MAVESRFVVIRHGVEVQTFMDKKAADDYDKMLDMADSLSTMLNATPFELSDEVKEDLSIYLAQNREDVLVALQAKKAKPAAKTSQQTAPTTKVVSTEEALNPKEVVTEKPSVEEESNIEEAIQEKVVAKKVVKKAKTKTASEIANSPTKKTNNSAQ